MNCLDSRLLRLYAKFYFVYKIICEWLRMEPNASDIAYRAIKSKILSREYVSGFQLKEVQVSKEIGLTRTPVREAFIRLEREGLLRLFPNRGAFVVELSVKEIEDFYQKLNNFIYKIIQIRTWTPDLHKKNYKLLIISNLK